MKPRKYRQGRRRIVAALAAASLVIAACGGDDSDDTDVTSEATPVGSADVDQGETAAPEEGDSDVAADDGSGGTLRLAITSDPPLLNPNLSTDSGLTEIVGLFAEGLITLDESLTPQPGLATDWTVSDDGTQYTFTLRQGVTWHDGEPFTSADVVYTLGETIQELPTAERFAPYIADVVANGDYEVTVTLTEPYAPILVGLSRLTVQMLPAHVYDGADLFDNPANLEPIGTGPFKFVEWTPGQSIEFERFEDYWDEGLPHFDRVVVQIMGDATAKVNAIRNGELDYVAGGELPLNQLEELGQTAGLVRAPSGDTPAHDFLFFNTAHEALSNPDVRKAIAMAIDREQVVTSGYQGAAIAAVGPFPPVFDTLFPDEADTYDDVVPFDPEGARALLDSAGFGDGLNLRLLYSSASFSVGTPVAATIRALLSEVGIDVELVDQDNAVYPESLFVNEDYDLAFGRFSTFSDPAIGIHRIYLCETDPERTYTNASGYCNEELDVVLERAATSPDPADRKSAYAEATEIILEDLPAYMLVLPSRESIASERIQDLDEQINSGPQNPNWAVASFAD